MDFRRFKKLNCSRFTWLVGTIFIMLSAGGMLTACNIGDVSLPTAFPIPNIDLENESDTTPQSSTIPDESPRQGPVINLPPTWTPASISGQATSQPAPEQPTDTDSSLQIYIVQEGDTLAEIAIQFGLALDALAQINNITDQDHIEVGQELIIPIG